MRHPIEIVYGKQIYLPGEFFITGTEIRVTDFVKDIQQRIRNLKHLKHLLYAMLTRKLLFSKS